MAMTDKEFWELEGELSDQYRAIFGHGIPIRMMYYKDREDFISKVREAIRTKKPVKTAPVEPGVLY